MWPARPRRFSENDWREGDYHAGKWPSLTAVAPYVTIDHPQRERTEREGRMPIALTALTATPATVAPGQSSQITPTITGDTAMTDTITGTDENGNAATVVITRLGEVLVADLNAADIVNGKAPAGKIIYTHSNPAAGVLTVNGAGVVFTAAP